MTSKPPKAQDMLLLATNILVGAFDFMEDLEKGETPLVAATKAIKKGKKRAKALRKSAKEAAEMVDERPMRRIEVEAKPLFELCPCGCNLPRGQCQGRSAGGNKR